MCSGFGWTVCPAGAATGGCVLHGQRRAVCGAGEAAILISVGKARLSFVRQNQIAFTQ